MRETMYDIMSMAKATHPYECAVGLHLSVGDDADGAIRAAKAELQSLDIGLNMQRANIYVLAKAHDPQAAKIVEPTGQRLRALFAEDFTSYSLTLTAFLCESNEAQVDGYAYNDRVNATYQFLTAQTPVYDSIFLLSDRNEYGRINHTNIGNLYKLMAYLPLVHNLNSRFNETLTARAGEVGRVLFASAGFGGRVSSVHDNFELGRHLHVAAQILENEINDSTIPARQSVHPEKIACAARLLPVSFTITSDIASVASEPISFVKLLGTTMVEAEHLLFRDRARRFYDENFQVETYVPKENNISKSTLLKYIVERVGHLQYIVEQLNSEIHDLSQKLEQYKAETVSINMSNILSFVDNIKNKIGEHYAIKYKLSSMQAMHAELSAEYAELNAYVEYMKELVASIKSVSVPTQEKTPVDSLLSQALEQAALNISLLRTDGLIFETHLFDETTNPCVLRLVGGFALEDLTRYNAMLATCSVAG